MAVKPSISCGNCGSPLGLNDKFCAKCGSAVTWDENSSSLEEKNPPDSKIVCPSCGILNLATNSTCSGCGSILAAVPSATPSKKKNTGGTEQSGRKAQSGTKAETWKILSVGGAVVVVVVLAIGVFRNSPKEFSPQNETAAPASEAGVSPTLIRDIDDFQKRVEANPEDSAALLQLANALHDAKFMPRAIETYKKYLKRKPSDPDARVDMAICFFESGDSQTAIQEMKTALTYDPKHQMAMFNIGIVLLNQGSMEESNGWFKKTVAVGPNTPTGQRAQQILTQHSTIKQ